MSRIGKNSIKFSKEINCSLRTNVSSNKDTTYRIQQVISLHDHLLDLDNYEDLKRKNNGKGVSVGDANQLHRKDHCSLFIYPTRPITNSEKPYIACFIQIPYVNPDLVNGITMEGRGGNQAWRQTAHN